MIETLRDTHVHSERLELFKNYCAQGLDSTEASRRSHLEAPARYATKVLKERLLTFCQVDGVRLSVEDFESSHPHIQLGQE